MPLSAILSWPVSTRSWKQASSSSVSVKMISSGVV
jgi:hypothetical protein